MLMTVCCAPILPYQESTIMEALVDNAEGPHTLFVPS